MRAKGKAFHAACSQNDPYKTKLGVFYFSEKFHSKKGYKDGLRLSLEDRGGAIHPKQVAILLPVYLVNPNSSGPFVQWAVSHQT